MTTKNILNDVRDVEVSVPQLGKPRMYVQEIHDAAEDLYVLESEIKTLDEKFEKKMKSKREFAEQAREKLLKMMQGARQKHIDVSGGEFVYVRTVKPSFQIIDEDLAVKFAKKEGLLRIDKTAINKKLLRMPKIPKGFEQVDTESLMLSKTEKK